MVISSTKFESFFLGGELCHFVVVAYLFVISSAYDVSGIALVLNSVNRVIEKKEMPPLSLWGFILQS